MISKSSRLPLLAGLLCLLLLGFAGTSNAAVRFTVDASPTEVINTGRSEVTGSVTLTVIGTGNVTGTSTGGNVQIGLVYSNPAMQIDNGTGSGIRIFFTTGFVPANPRILGVTNIDINGRMSGFITLDMDPGATPVEGDFIRIDGVRGRIYDSIAQTPGEDLFVDLQSINDPAANSFAPDRIRVAKSFDGMGVDVDSDALLLCFPTDGTPPGQSLSYNIQITEGFARAFVDEDANNDGMLEKDRVDSGGQLGPPAPPIYTTGGGLSSADYLGDPTVSTHFLVWLEGIPASVSSISWPSFVCEAGGGNSILYRESYTSIDTTTGTASAIYSFQTENQTDESDIDIEYYNVKPMINLDPDEQKSTGQILAGVTLYPQSGRPDFEQMFESDEVAINNPPDDPFALYASIIRCNCFLLFTYVSADAGWNTGIVVANTTGDTAPFGTSEAPDQLGKITFYFYDRDLGYVGMSETAEVNSGASFVDLVSNILPATVTTFSGYIIAKAEFQFCHGFAFIADEMFGSIAHGYIANVIPDPAIKFAGAVRGAAAAGDWTNVPAGEGLNN